MVYAQCVECVTAKRVGADVSMTLYARLTTHLVRQHNISPAQAKIMSAVQRSNKVKTKGNRSLFMCACGMAVVKKTQHLRSGFHPELRSEQEHSQAFVEALAQFRKVVKQPKTIKPRDVEAINEEKRDSEEEERESGEEEMEVDDGEEEKPLLTRLDLLSTKKSARLKTKFRDYWDVKEWGIHLQSRLGSGASAEQADLAKLMVNKLLAVIAYKEGDVYAPYLIWEGHMEVFDTWIIAKYQPGTVKAAYIYVKKFLHYLNSKEKISQVDLQKTEDILKNLTAATYKSDLLRRRAKRIEDEENLPVEGILAVRKAFVQSKYVTGTLNRWRSGDVGQEGEMRGILIWMIAMVNGTRTGEFISMKIRNVLSASEFNDGRDMTITLEEHKTAANFTAMIHLSKPVYMDLVQYVRATRGDRKDEDFVFYKEKGNPSPVSHSYINTWLQLAWKRAEMDKLFPKYIPSLTANRKLVTTSARSRDQSRADDIAFMLCHRRKTADSHYDARQSKSRSQGAYTWFSNRSRKAVLTPPPPPQASKPPTAATATHNERIGPRVPTPPPPPATRNTLNATSDPRVRPCYVALEKLDTSGPCPLLQ